FAIFPDHCRERRSPRHKVERPNQSYHPQYPICAQNRLTHVIPADMNRYFNAATVIGGLTGKLGPKRGVSAANSMGGLAAQASGYSSSDSSPAFRPDAAVFTVTTCSIAKRPR